MRISLVLLAMAVLARPAAGQDARLQGRLDSATLRWVTAYIDSSRAEGLPEEPLVQKALEGASKGATGDRITAAVRNLGAIMRTARGALGPASSHQEIVAGAAALRAGADPEGLRNLRRVRGTADLGVPLAVLADLVGLGVRVDAAYQSVLDLARTRATDAEFIRLKERRLEQQRP
jgi:hypothetical protein